MSRRDRALARQLVAALGSAASYNDKGYYWRRDTPEQSEALRAEFQAELLALAAQLPDLPPALREAIASGAAADDWTGDYRIAARDWLAGGS